MEQLFELALRGKFRFDSVRGELTTEDLFQLPLTSRNGLDLDNVAKAVNAELKEMGEESFVEVVSPRKTELEYKLEIVKYIIKMRKDENAAKLEFAKRKQEIEKIESLLERKSEEALSSLSEEELKSRLASLRS